MTLDPNQIAATLKAMQDRQMRVLTGTVISTSTNAQTVPVRLDNVPGGNGEEPQVIIPSVIGRLPVDTRVSIITVPPAGMMIVGIIGAPFNLIGLWDYFVMMTENTVWMDRQFYTSNDTWNKPTSPLFMGVMVRLQAGGGASGGIVATPATDTACSGPGEGGGYMSALILAANLAATEAVVVGAGGTVGAAGNNPGNAGGSSSFGSSVATTCTIAGGAGGAGGGSAAAGQTFQAGGASNQWSSLVLGSSAVLFDFQQGDNGQNGFRFANTMIYPGFGGGSRMGGITKISGISAGQIAPNGGSLFGGGASGRGINGVIVGGGGVAATTGAAGGQGCVIVEEYYRT